MTLLLLGGTGDAKRIATRLVEQGVDLIISLAGATRNPDAMPAPARIGGFGGAEGFEAYLDEAGITAVLDATHPYAHRITNRTAAICKARNMPHAIFHRPPWEPKGGDRWIEIEREEDAASHIAKGQTVFLGTGRQTLEKFANLEGRRVICRQIDPPSKPFPFEGGEYLIGRPPFSTQQERGLFRSLKVDWLVVKNAGGEQSITKLLAARELGIPVLMVKRPPVPDATIFSTVAEAVAWAAQ